MDRDLIEFLVVRGVTPNRDHPGMYWRDGSDPLHGEFIPISAEGVAALFCIPAEILKPSATPNYDEARTFRADRGLRLL